MGQVGIDVDQLREGSVGDPMAMLLQQRAHRHRWQIAGLSVSEEIAQVDQRAVRRRVLDLLREAIERAGGVWVTMSAYPFPYRSALNFRIDYDQFDAADFHATLDTIAGYEDATSHFVNAAAYLSHDDALRRLAGLDVGSHGYHHHTYRTVEENFANIQRGIKTLEALGFEPSGFVAPGGRFNRNLLRAMDRLGVSHSSEFALAYDELPFFPEDSNVLQIPIHPICLGLFLENVNADGPRAAAATQQIVRTAVDYFRQTARGKYRHGEPVFLYGHPTGRLGRYPQVLRAVFDTADEFGAIWKTTLSEFAAWWRARAEVQLRVVRRGERFEVQGDNQPQKYRIGIEYWRGEHVARMPLRRRGLSFSPSALAYENRKPRANVRPVRLDQPEGLRGHLKRLIDWERETPINEIPRSTLRNWTKRILRTLQK